MRLLADRLINQYGIDFPKVHIPMGGASPKKPIERYLPELAGSVESTSQLLTLLFNLLMFAHGTYLTLSHRNLTSNWCTPSLQLDARPLAAAPATSPLGGRCGVARLLPHSHQPFHAHKNTWLFCRALKCRNSRRACGESPASVVSSAWKRVLD